ncbi:hypothetical protein ES332_A08G054700v1 [Gossypium tomentosum]|uniref:Uncharacterized protein n=1 Tax=Gossypium tomentosum TaxID=34277 RepID=A0A5D2PC03_GOSTO|nr:hypothetical protein ES332_A08G054700v1 [Gossypium tomentosum]
MFFFIFFVEFFYFSPTYTTSLFGVYSQSVRGKVNGAEESCFAISVKWW